MSYTIRVTLVEVNDETDEDIKDVDFEDVVVGITESEAEDFFTELKARAADIHESDFWRALPEDTTTTPKNGERRHDIDGGYFKWKRYERMWECDRCGALHDNPDITY